MTGVGGTSLTLNGSAYGSETVWNNQPTHVQSPQGGASGGGFSINFAKPSWQSAPGVSSGNRQVPDVALNADLFNKGYLIYCTATASGCSSSHPWVDGGGTAVRCHNLPLPVSDAGASRRPAASSRLGVGG